MKLAFATLLVVFLVVSSAFVESTYVTPQLSCDTLCGERCSKASQHKECIKDCNGCCEKLGCVPSGTFGNKDECPGYADIKNTKGTGKCP